MKTRKHKLAFKFLLLLIIAVNMPLNLFADAYQNPGGIQDYSNGLIYGYTSNYNELYVIHVSDTTIGILNIPSEVKWEDYYGYYKTSKVTSIHGIDYETWNPYTIFYPLYLQCINIPETVTSIKEGIFFPHYLRITSGPDIYDDSHLAELMEINVDPANPNFTSVDGVLYNKDKSVLIACPPARTECDIPASVTQIANYAFAGCRNMKSLTIPNTITQIGASAFEDCVNLQNITIPESVSAIGDHAFKDCKSLVAIDLPNSLDSIGEHMFENCKSLVSVKLPTSLTSLGNYSFMDCESLVSIDLPASLNSIGDYVFENCKSLASVDLPASLTSIGEHAFENCKSLVSVKLPTSLTSLGNYSFM
ncbi:MAG: leucine-rich repeat domain-containing protein, partial [Muribaculaceae bacterium]|nr:leucine-rich repeat domain-containing protein [Muribaculaceae bacterium]